MAADSTGQADKALYAGDMRALLLSVAWILLVSCGGSEKDEEAGSSGSEDNFTCEMDCVEEAHPRLADCYVEDTACLAECASLDDEECVGRCRDQHVQCSRSYPYCSAWCPCVQEQAECLLECEDLECWPSCEPVYDECASDGSPLSCVEACDDTRFACVQACEASATTGAELAACRAPCDDAYRPCHAACLN